MYTLRNMRASASNSELSAFTYMIITAQLFSRLEIKQKNGQLSSNTVHTYIYQVNVMLRNYSVAPYVTLLHNELYCWMADRTTDTPHDIQSEIVIITLNV